MNWGRMFSYIYLGIGAYSALILAAEIIIIIFGGDMKPKQFGMQKNKSKKKRKKIVKGK